MSLDITMCFGKNCKIKEKCVRFKSVPDTYQSYFRDSPVESDGKTCAEFWEYKKKPIKRKKKS